jgi:hypothetical protein
MIPKKPALGLDPGGGNRFSDKHVLELDPRDHAQRKNLDLDPIHANRIKV